MFLINNWRKKTKIKKRLGGAIKERYIDVSRRVWNQSLLCNIYESIGRRMKSIHALQCNVLTKTATKWNICLYSKKQAPPRRSSRRLILCFSFVLVATWCGSRSTKPSHPFHGVFLFYCNCLKQTEQESTDVKKRKRRRWCRSADSVGRQQQRRERWCFALICYVSSTRSRTAIKWRRMQKRLMILYNNVTMDNTHTHSNIVLFTHTHTHGDLMKKHKSFDQ